MSQQSHKIYSIPAGNPFSRDLCAQILEETQNKPEKLAEYRILVPTRRACRVLRNTFLELTKGKPLILPLIQSIGDVDEEELSFHMADKDNIEHIASLPPAIPPLKRQLMLARAIQTARKQQGEDHLDFSHAMALAKALAHLMDQTYTEGLDLANLKNIVPAEFANHWQVTIDFLKIISNHWPIILAENNVIDAAQRRHTLITTLAEYWKKNPPKTPVIIAGTTGSIPAVTNLIKTVSVLPNGRVVLPGFDTEIDQDDWDTLDETHPQFGFKHLLAKIEYNKHDIELWPQPQKHHTKMRHTLAEEIMRPSATSTKWTKISQNNNLKSKIKESINNIEYYECETSAQEAELISLILRELLESPQKTASLITPDRNLARRVSIACKRWGISLDDSAGYELSNTPLGIFMRTALDAIQKNLSPVAFLALLKQQILSTPENPEWAQAITELEMNLLRGLKPQNGIEGLEQRVEQAKQIAEKNNKAINLAKTEEKINQLKPILLNYYSAINEDIGFKNTIKAHLYFCENLLNTVTNNATQLWSNEEGEAAAQLLSELLEHSPLISDITIEDYAETLTQILKSTSVRKPTGVHPRLSILGQLEARLIDCDLLILAELNEGTWPADPGHDPWMSRPMRKEFGLPSPERSIGLAAHDFVQGICHEHVIITRSKINNGTPTVPARWIQRFDTVLQSANINLADLNVHPYLNWVESMNKAESHIPCDRPSPNPPLSERPHKLSVTKIEQWLKDPYSIYAQYILKLRPIEKLEKQPDAAEKGTLIHNTLDRFVQEENEIKKNKINELTIYSQKECAALSIDPEALKYWWPRFERAMEWYLNHEETWRTHATPHITEAEGQITIKTSDTEFILTGRADRIDKMNDDTYALIDYKSGGDFPLKALKNGDLPQLPLEALILQENGFTDIQSGAVSTLSYWILSGGKTAGKTTEYSGDLSELIEKTKENIKTLINTYYSEPTPYHSIPDLQNAPRFNDYEHLARVEEWSTLETTEATS